MRPPVFDCLLGRFHRSFLSDAGKLPYDHLGRTNGYFKLQNLFAPQKKTPTLYYNEIPQTVSRLSFWEAEEAGEALMNF